MLEPGRKIWVAPEPVSKVFREKESWQGTPEVVLAETVAWIRPRVPEIPALEDVRLIDVAAFAARVKVVAVPIVAPEAFENVTEPVQEEAAPLVGLAAMLLRLTPMLSVLPNPTTGNAYVVVRVNVVCANADPVKAAATAKRRPKFRVDIVFPFRILGSAEGNRPGLGRYYLDGVYRKKITK
jgi:hypothetical protein